MKTTLNEIKKYGPCNQDGNAEDGGWQMLLKNLDKTEADDEPIDLMTILNSNGIEDAIWVLRCFDYKEYCLFLADVAESVLPIYESEYPDDNHPRLVIKAIRNYKKGEISKEQLDSFADDSIDAAADANYSDAAYAAYSTYSAAHSADASTYAAVYATANADAKWNEIKQLFIKHFG